MENHIVAWFSVWLLSQPRSDIVLGGLNIIPNICVWEKLQSCNPINNSDIHTIFHCRTLLALLTA